ncbi:MAG: hypothetical protein Q4F05_07795 [bacterium]|nr:hypothetical protein [bacterium]
MAVFGVQYTRKGSAAGAGISHDIAKGETIKFDTGLVMEDSSITYALPPETNTGIFNMGSAGYYFVAWQIVAKTGIGLAGQRFDLILSNGTTSEDRGYPSASGVKNAHFSGTALVHIPAILTGQTWTLKIVNIGDNCTLSDQVECNANISILRAVQSSVEGAVFQCIKSGVTDPITVASGAAVPFDTTPSYMSSNPNIRLTAATGEIITETPGRYLFDWGVNVAGSTATNGIAFELEKTEDGAASVAAGLSESPVNQPCTIYGSTMVDVGVAPSTFILKNANTGAVTHTLGGYLEAGREPLRAWIRVVEVA